MNNYIELSIIIPSFNHANLTCKMIESILANTYDKWELIIVDDGSDISELEILEKFCMYHEQILIIKRKDLPKGANKCRNIGFKRARGKYIIFFDSDDYIPPYCLAERVAQMEKNPDYDFIIFPSGTYSNNFFDKSIQDACCGYHIYTNDIKMFAKRRLPFIVWNNIYKKASLENKNILWDEKLKSLQDADFNVKTILAGLKYKYANSEPDYGYRINSNANSVSKKMTSKQHQKNNVYALLTFYNMFQAKYGHKYDLSLFIGALWIYNHSMSDGIDIEYAIDLQKIVINKSAFFGILFRMCITATQFLSKFMHSKIARQIPMAPYLLWRIVQFKCAKIKMKKAYNRNKQYERNSNFTSNL